MKKKQVFKTVATHLLTQERKAVLEDDADICWYKLDGISCAIGVLIDDEHYNRDIEGNSADNVDVIKAVEDSLNTKVNSKDRDLLCKLQDIRDYSSVSSWRTELEDLSELTFDKTLEDLGVEA